MNEEQVAHWKKYLMGKIYVGDQMGMLDTDKFVNPDELPEGYRILHPGTPQTKDYRPNRLNIHVDEKCVVCRVNVG